MLATVLGREVWKQDPQRGYFNKPGKMMMVWVKAVIMERR